MNWQFLDVFDPAIDFIENWWWAILLVMLAIILMFIGVLPKIF